MGVYLNFVRNKTIRIVTLMMHIQAYRLQNKYSNITSRYFFSQTGYKRYIFTPQPCHLVRLQSLQAEIEALSSEKKNHAVRDKKK